MIKVVSQGGLDKNSLSPIIQGLQTIVEPNMVEGADGTVESGTGEGFSGRFAVLRRAVVE